MDPDVSQEDGVVEDSFNPETEPWDENEKRSMRCRRCHLPRVFRRRRTRHKFHFMLAIGTLGLWLPVWGFIILFQLMQPWTCTVCGVHQRK